MAAGYFSVYCLLCALFRLKGMAGEQGWSLLPVLLQHCALDGEKAAPEGQQSLPYTRRTWMLQGLFTERGAVWVELDTIEEAPNCNSWPKWSLFPTYFLLSHSKFLYFKDFQVKFKYLFKIPSGFPGAFTPTKRCSSACPRIWPASVPPLQPAPRPSLLSPGIFHHCASYPMPCYLGLTADTQINKTGVWLNRCCILSSPKERNFAFSGCWVSQSVIVRVLVSYLLSTAQFSASAEVCLQGVVAGLSLLCFLPGF